MSTLITRLFRNTEQATRAVAELRRNGFNDEDINVTGPGPSPGAPGGEIAASIARAGVSKRAAQAYAADVRDGAVAVSVRAVFGWAATATETLERSGALASAIPDEGDLVVTRDPAAPFSSSLHLPVLSHNPTPLSSLLALRVLSKRQNPRTRLLHAAAPLSSVLHVPTLSGDPAPLSRRLGLSLLRDNITGRSRGSFGLPLLTRRGRPFLPVRLLRTAAPFSRLFGLKLLSSNPAPLSSALGLPVLTEDDTGKPPH
jgi:hypothetical protein